MTEQFDSLGRRKNYSPERRRKLAENMKAKWADPDFCAKRAEASRRAVKDKWANRREEAMAQMLEMLYSPKRCAYMHNRLKDPERMKRHQAQLAMLNSDPAVAEKRRAGLKAKWADPEHRKKMARAYDKRRGFRVPERKRKEYQFLRVVKKIPAREVGRMLGLV